MWIETEGGDLVNLARAESVGEDTEIRTKIIVMYPNGRVYGLADFHTPKQAQAAMDRLKKWLASDGEDGLPEVTQEGNATIVSPNWTQVFSFRTLSEDDEFKE